MTNLTEIETRSLKRVALPFIRKFTSRYDLTISDFQIKINKTLFREAYAYGIMEGYLTAYNLAQHDETAKNVLYDTGIAFLRRAEAQIIINQNVINI